MKHWLKERTSGPPGREALRTKQIQGTDGGLEGSLGSRRGRRAQEGRGTFQKERRSKSGVEITHGFLTLRLYNFFSDLSFHIMDVLGTATC